MSNSLPNGPASTSQFTLGAMLKYIAVLAVLLALNRFLLNHYWTLVLIGAATGMFLTEHFASSRISEFMTLFCLPLLFASLAMVLTLLQNDDALHWSSAVLWAILGLLVGIVPVAVSVIMLSLISAMVFKLTGVRFLKFDWNRDVTVQK